MIALLISGCSSSDGMKPTKNKTSLGVKILDGPYLFYEDEDLITSVRGEVLDDSFKEVKQTFDLNNIRSTSHEVRIPSKNVSFTFEVADDHSIPPHTYEAPERIFALSDVEGDFDFFQKLLLSQGVIDKNYNWSYGDGHLVVLGDMFDRGDLVTESLWLMYKLDQQAQKSGGVVHIILGNHEAMALEGDDRYIHKKYEKVTKKLKLGYEDLYSRNTVLGYWLRSKNSVEIIGRTLFVHGGISPTLTARGLDIQTVNELVRSVVNMSKGDRLSSEQRLVMGSDGPLWYREYVGGKTSPEGVELILSEFGVGHIIIGHTVVEEVTGLYGNSVYAIDVKRKGKDVYEALLIEKNQFYKVTSEGGKTAIP